MPEMTKAEKLQEALLALQYENALLENEQAKRHKTAREEQEMLNHNARKLGATVLDQQRKMELDKQNACPHLKPNAQPAIAGQWDHSGTYHWICAYCSKEWTGGELPLHLRIDMEKVGGPQRS